MSDAAGAELSPIKRALLEIRELRARLAQLEAERNEPIAIVGMSMRLPGGVHDAASFEALLWEGRDAIGPIPASRWSTDELYDPDVDAPGKMVTRFGGFLEGVDQFDAEFFGIAPREAECMDPQQRLLLELAWEAIEDAGCAPTSLAGSRTGVYLGVANSDYGRLQFADREHLHVYSASGSAYSVAAGRLSYFLGLHGPSIALDTACSSSLSAIHLACQALRRRECDRALAGGVNLILTPEANIGFSKAGMMAPDGRCKTFDAAADGYVRSEGCALVVLRRLSEAIAAGDRVLAVIRGSALNQDGRSGGLTAPNGPAQEAVLRAALAAAGVEPREVGYVETHGTGTPLGDPIEVGALGSVFTKDRDPAQPLAIGSVKTNLGHLEAAAGIAGLIKVVLMLGRREIPPHLHYVKPSPHIDWAGLPITVPTRVVPWGTAGARLIAGVSSFGFSGTNAHVVLEAPPPSPAPAQPQQQAHLQQLLVLSARDDAALRELAGRYAARLEGEADVTSVCRTAATGRTHFRRRIAAVGHDAPELSRALRDFVAGRAPATLAATGGAASAKVRVAFLFTGFGAQQLGMARELYGSSPVFRDALDRCATLLEPRLGRPLTELLYGEAAEEASLDDPALGHPALFAVEYALARLWMSWGIEPDAVLGHSLGEYVAACIAGVMSLEDALRLVAERGRLSRELPADGGMLAVMADEGAIIEAAGPLPPDVVVAAVNAPTNVVLSGRRTALDGVAERLRASGIEARPVRVSQAFHSPLVQPALAGLRQVAAGIAYSDPQVDLISNATGGVVKAGHFAGGSCWVEHMRSPVQFAQSLRALVPLGITHCIEIGPHPVLTAFGTETLAAADVRWLPSLRRGRDDWSELLESLQSLYVDGAEVDWAGFGHGSGYRRVALPTYPFRHRRYWSTGAAASVAASAETTDAAIAMARQAEQAPLDVDVSSFPRRWDALARLTEAHAIETLRASGLFLRGGESLDVDTVLQRAGIGPTYRHLVERWLERLATRRLLRADAGRYTSEAPLPEPGLAALWSEVRERLTDDGPMLRYLERCGELVIPVLTGRTSPLETLFPNGSFELAEDLYRRSAGMRYVNAIAAAGIDALALAIPAGRTLRVLEVGAGTGGTTAGLLPRLPAKRTRYVFTDVSQLFLDQARESFSDWSFMEFRLFDLEKDPAGQGLDAASFDVIVAANAVHATRDLRLSLQRLRGLLAPGGALLLVESTQHHAWFDMTTGLIEGWQRFDDDLRGDNPLLAPAQWRAALADAGFEHPGSWPSEDSVAAAIGQHAILARVPGHSLGGEHSVTPEASGGQLGPGDLQQSALEAFRANLAAASAAERTDLLRAFVRERVKKVLRLGADQDPGRSERLMDLGFDSLMAVQLRGLLGKDLGLERPLPATLLFDHPTIDAIVEFLRGRLGEQPAPASQDAAPEREPAREAREAEVAAMSDEQIEALLQARLEGK